MNGHIPLCLNVDSPGISLSVLFADVRPETDSHFQIESRVLGRIGMREEVDIYFEIRVVAQPSTFLVI